MLGLTVGPPLAGAEEVRFRSNGYMLYGCIMRPAGRAPFPAVIYNHGSEKYHGPCGPPALASTFVKHGFVYFMFHRHGHGRSPGDYILELQKKILAETSDRAMALQQIAALQDDYNRDVEEAVRWFLSRPEVDRNRVIMTGISFGGVQTLLTAEKGLGLRAFVPFAPGAQSWQNVALRQRLITAVQNAKAPIFLVQAKNDYSLGPSEVLGPFVRDKGPPNMAKVYPAYGTGSQDGHFGFATQPAGIAIWESDMFEFIAEALK
jgi:carboxymethylenebutenolidase